MYNQTYRVISDAEHNEMVAEYNTMMENIQKRTLYEEDIGM